jgi:hypothetical protein
VTYEEDDVLVAGLQCVGAHLGPARLDHHPHLSASHRNVPREQAEDTRPVDVDGRVGVDRHVGYSPVPAVPRPRWCGSAWSCPRSPSTLQATDAGPQTAGQDHKMNNFYLELSVGFYAFLLKI